MFDFVEKIQRATIQKSAKLLFIKFHLAKYNLSMSKQALLFVLSFLIIRGSIELGIISDIVLYKKRCLIFISNPLEETSRLWTLGVCGALRRITLRGTPLADLMEYRTMVASALPMLTHLDDFSLQDDSEFV